jgi:hypothetical protein
MSTINDKRRELNHMRVLHYIFANWLSENDLLSKAIHEVNQREDWNTLLSSMEDDDLYMMDYPLDPIRCYCSHMESVPLELEREWREIEQGFRQAVSQVLIEDRTEDANESVREFYAEGINPQINFEQLSAALQAMEDEEDSPCDTCEIKDICEILKLDEDLTEDQTSSHTIESKDWTATITDPWDHIFNYFGL